MINSEFLQVQMDILDAVDSFAKNLTFDIQLLMVLYLVPFAIRVSFLGMTISIS